MELFLKGFAAGFVIAVPIGPVAILCFRRVLTGGRLVSLATVLGAAAADTFYGLAAALGVAAVTRLVDNHRFGLKLCGGLFLVLLGVTMLRSKATASPPADARRPGSLHTAFLSTLLLMLANPAIMVSFAAVFAALGLGPIGLVPFGATQLGTGLFLGSAAWWLVFQGAAACMREGQREIALRVINRGAGGLICVLGLWQLATLAWKS